MRTYLLNEDDAIVINGGIVIRVLEVGVEEVQLEIEYPDEGSAGWGEPALAELQAVAESPAS